MTFNDWKSKREWWKQDGPYAFKPVWSALIGAGHKPEEVAEMLDRIGAAMADEFGGSF